MSENTSTVWLAGATGLIGRALTAQLLDQRGTQLHLLLRRSAPANLPESERLHTHRIDFSRTDLGAAALPAPAQVFIALGSTMAQAGSQQAFRAVDFDAVLNVARAAKAAGARSCAVVSALGADAQSKVFYNRVKGEAEQALSALGFERLVLARPSLLSGDRAALGQPSRPGESWALRLSQPLAPLIPARWRPISADRVARAMRLAMAQANGTVCVLESAQMQTLGSP